MQLKLFFFVIHLLTAIVGTCLAAPFSNTTTCISSYGNGVCTTQDGCDTGELRTLMKLRALTNPLITGYAVKGDCPTTLVGNLCCIQATDPVTPEEFVAYIGRVYDLAVQYPNKGSKTANQLVMEWGRHIDYSDSIGLGDLVHPLLLASRLEWGWLAGSIDQDFVEYVNKAGIVMLQTLKDPFYPINTHISHTLAAMNVAYLSGSPSGADINKADAAGWGGDWWQFYGDWRNDMDKKTRWANGTNYCADNLATASSTSHFKLLDMVEDADGYNIGMALHNDHTLSIVDQFHELLLGGGYKTRMARFYKGRFGGTMQSASAVASYVLEGRYAGQTDSVLLTAGQQAVIFGVAGPAVRLPGDLPDSELQPFCDGFGNTMANLVANEAEGIFRT